MNVGRGLSYDQGPPFGAPLRLLLLAPAFLLATALAALALGDAWLANRWSPATLALTHLLTLGYLGASMAGAWLQMLPVVAGAPVPGARTIAGMTLFGLVLGVPLLAGGLLLGEPGLMAGGGAALAVAWLPFVAGTLMALVGAKSLPRVVWPMRKAWLAMSITLSLGWMLVTALAGWAPSVDVMLVTDLHAMWGLGGWVLILAMGVAYQVVPMLQITPAYPDAASKWLTWAVLAGLALITCVILLAGDSTVAWRLATIPPAIAAVAFALATLRIQRRRRRKLPDATLDFWRLGMASLVVAAPMFVGLPWLPESWRTPAELSVGIVFLLGFAASVVNGMLYKIVPFLAWFHLQTQLSAKVGEIPSMKQLIPDRAARGHFRFHLAACLLLAVCPFLPAASAIPALLLLAAGALALWRNLIGVRRQFLAHGGQL